MKQKQRIFSLFLLVALVFSLAAPVSAAGEMTLPTWHQMTGTILISKTSIDNDIVHGTTPPPSPPRGK